MILVSAVVLAAGTSSRLGRPKQLLDLEGRPVLQHVVDAVAGSRVDEIVVVLGHEAERVAAALALPERARVVVNPDYEAGQSTSVRVGLGALGDDVDAAVIVLGDQPRLRAPIVDRAVAVFNRGRGPIVRACFSGTPGHPVVVARSEWAGFTSLSGDRGARDLLATSHGKVQEVEMGEPPLEDLDTWDQYERIKDG